MGVEDWPIALGEIQDTALAEMLSGDDSCFFQYWEYVTEKHRVDTKRTASIACKEEVWDSN